jgi:GNAT superfamily N-acetyltransferase
MKWQWNNFEVDSDRDRIDFDRLYGYLSTAYWSSDRSADEVHTAWNNSGPVFGLYDTDGALKGCCRVVTDTRTFAWLADVYIDEALRGQGLGKFMMQCVLAHPDCERVRQFILATQDAHGLYRQFGWEPLAEPARYMIRRTTP